MQEMLILNFKQGCLESVMCEDSKAGQGGCFQQSCRNTRSHSSNHHHIHPTPSSSKLLLKRSSNTKRNSLCSLEQWGKHPKEGLENWLHTFRGSSEKTMPNLGYWNNFPTGRWSRQNNNNMKKLMWWPAPSLLPLFLKYKSNLQSKCQILLSKDKSGQNRNTVRIGNTSHYIFQRKNCNHISRLEGWMNRRTWVHMMITLPPLLFLPSLPMPTFPIAARHNRWHRHTRLTENTLMSWNG